MEAARSAAAAVLQGAQERVDGAASTSIGGRAVVRRGEVHSPFQLLDRHREMEAAAATELKDKADRSALRATKKADRHRERAENAAAGSSGAAGFAPTRSTAGARRG